MDNKRDFKGVWIPKAIWLSTELTLQEKVFLVEINSLDNEDSCFASNEYFAEFFGLSKSRVSEVINMLIEKKYIRSTIHEDEGNKRTLEVISFPEEGLSQSRRGSAPIPNDNNTVNNTSNSNIVALELYKGYVAFINKTLGKNYRGDSKSKRQLAARLKDGYTNLDIKKAIVNASKESFHIESKFKHLTPEFFTRADKLDKFINAGDGVPAIEKKEVTPIDVNEHFGTEISDENYGDYKP